MPSGLSPQQRDAQACAGSRVRSRVVYAAGSHRCTSNASGGFIACFPISFFSVSPLERGQQPVVVVPVPHNDLAAVGDAKYDTKDNQDDRCRGRSCSAEARNTPVRARLISDPNITRSEEERSSKDQGYVVGPPGPRFEPLRIVGTMEALGTIASYVT